MPYLSIPISNNLFQRRVRDRYLSEVTNKKSCSEVKKKRKIILKKKKKGIEQTILFLLNMHSHS